MRNLLKKNAAVYRLFCRMFVGFQRYKNGLRADKRAIKKFQGKFQGKRCFIIGSGPSLTLDRVLTAEGRVYFCFQ